jgi:hypothetical protein
LELTVQVTERLVSQSEFQVSGKSRDGFVAGAGVPSVAGEPGRVERRELEVSRFRGFEVLRF